MKFETDPLKIREKSNKAIRQQTNLDHLTQYEQRIVIQMILACGDTSIVENLRISDSFTEKCFEVFEEEDYEILCDTDSVICHLKEKYLRDEPVCLISKANVISQAKANKKTRSMTAVDLWEPYLDDSIIIIGDEPTALFRFLEVLNGDTDKKPALIIATPPGLEGATESKQHLWDLHEKLDIPCITLLGTKGSSAIASAAMNALLKIHQSLPKSSED